MTSFLDGPAKGVNLSLRNPTRYLRVVRKGDKFDALDLPTDKPEPGEELFAYVLSPTSMRGFACTDKGCYPIAEYVFLPEQPPQWTMRSRVEWQAWVESHYRRQTPL